MLQFTIISLILFLLRRTDSTHYNHSVLIDRLTFLGYIEYEDIEAVMSMVDRKNYVDKNPYEDYAVPAGFGATFSSPQLHATIMGILRNYLDETGYYEEGKKVLDVGCGTGYLTACMALMIGEFGYVVGIDHIPELVKRANESVLKDNPILLKKKRVRFVEGDGRLGVPEHGPYDVIHIGAVSETEEVPQALLKQLKVKGRLVMPIDRLPTNEGEFLQILLFNRHRNGTITKTVCEGIYLDRSLEMLTDKEKQLCTLPKKFSDIVD